MKYTESIFTNSKEILFNDDYAAFAHNVSDEGIALNAENKKIVPAGTPINDAGKVATVTEGKSDAIGILLSDADVTYGTRPGSLLSRGNIVKSKLPASFTDNEAAIIAVMPMIKLF